MLHGNGGARPHQVHIGLGCLVLIDPTGSTHHMLYASMKLRRIKSTTADDARQKPRPLMAICTVANLLICSSSATAHQQQQPSAAAAAARQQLMPQQPGCAKEPKPSPRPRYRILRNSKQPRRKAFVS